MAIVIKREKLPFWQRIYIFEIIRGMLITGRHFLKNLFNPSRMATFRWPEVKKPIDPGYRSEHRLMLRDDESIRCTACMLCATACPANCIHIEAAEGDIPEAEKYAEEYTIDLLRCIYCGYCVEACPCDAIRMDTQKPVSAYFDRADFIKDINYLKDNHGEKSPYSIAKYP
jgi:NADH-quinone oxidoreductase subunit I